MGEVVMLSKEDVRIDLHKKKFKFRVAGIVIKDNKVLVDKMRNNEFYCLPGGHVEICEDTLSAVKRELKEELYFKFKIKNLVFVHENFFVENKKKFHELCFYYLAYPQDKNFKPEDIVVSEVDNNEQLYHNYKWIDLSKLKEFDLRPKEIFYMINKNTYKQIFHTISKDK